jgi:hypothetical protein
MGKEARIGLLLGAAACLMAVMVSWIVEELQQQESTAGQESLAESPQSATKEKAPEAEAPLTASS